MTPLEYAAGIGAFAERYGDEAGNVYLVTDGCGWLTDLTLEGTSWVDDNTLLLPRETAERLESFQILLDEDACREYAPPRRPYYRMRGRPVTKEQAFEIIRRTDNFFHNVDRVVYEEPEWIGCLNFDNWLLEQNHYPRGYGWIHTDGAVGSNAITQTYPAVEEYVREWLEKLCAFPYLDLIVALTDHDEVPRQAQGRENWESDPACDRFFYDGVRLGIHVHDKTVAILGRDETIRVYDDYRARYETDREKYIPEYYQDRGLVQADTDYLRRCIAAWGLDPDETLRTVPEYIWRPRS